MAESFLDRISPSKPVRQPSGPVVPPSDAYTQKALDDELAHLSGLGAGSRNSELNISALKLARLPIDRDTLRDKLIDACEANGHLGDDGIGMVEGTIDSAFDKADREGPRMIPEKPLATVSSINRSQPPPLMGAVGLTSANQFRSRLLSSTAIRNMPPPEPLIGGVLNRGTTALLAAAWGSGKSFIAIDWACSLATGRPWMGRPTEKVKVLYVVAEGVAGFSSRLNAWETAWRYKLDDSAIQFLPIPVNLMTQDVEMLAEEIRHGGFEFIVLDTLARCMVGADENSARDVGIVVDSMTRLVDATPEHRGCVLGIHHFGKMGTVRGSSALEGGMDTVYGAEKNGDISLRCKKQKDGPDTDRHTLRLMPIEGTGSCVVSGVTGKNAEDNAASVYLLKKLFTQMFSETGATNTDLRAVAMENGMTQTSYYDARGELLRDRWLVSTGSGSRVFFERGN